MATKRINIGLSEEMIDFYQDLAEEMGIPRSAAMVMAMKVFMDQQRSLKLGDMCKTMEGLIEHLNNNETNNNMISKEDINSKS